METEKLLLEIYGKVEATNVNVAHILAHQQVQDQKVDKLHFRVDKHSKIISYASGAIFVIGVVAGIAWDWCKRKLGCV